MTMVAVFAVVLLVTARRRVNAKQVVAELSTFRPPLEDPYASFEAEMIRHGVIRDSKVLAAAITLYRTRDAQQTDLANLQYVICVSRPVDGGRQLCRWASEEASLQDAVDALQCMLALAYPETFECAPRFLDDMRDLPHATRRFSASQLACKVLITGLGRIGMEVPPDLREPMRADDSNQSAYVSRMKQLLTDNRVEIRRKAEAWYANEVKRIEERKKALRR